MHIIVKGISNQTMITDIHDFNDSWKNLTQNIFSSNRFIRSIQLDGVTYYGDYDIQILNRFDSIETVEVETCSETELLDEVLSEINMYMTRLLEGVDSLSGLFYGDLSDNDWKLISEFTQGLDWLYKAITMCIDLMIKTNEGLGRLYPHFQAAVQQLNLHLQSMDQLFQEEDYIGIGDLITYELKPIFEEIDHALNGNG